MRRTTENGYLHEEFPMWVNSDDHHYALGITFFWVVKRSTFLELFPIGHYPISDLRGFFTFPFLTLDTCLLTSTFFGSFCHKAESFLFV